MAEVLRILAVDDEPSIVASMHLVFEAPRYFMATALDGGAALDQVASDSVSYDIVVTDNNMPLLSGVELVRRLRETNFRGKIVVLSAHLTAEIRAAYRQLKVDMMIDKPFDIHQLRKTIEQLAA
jgi:DNA-binding response OmpR family regulator